MTMPNLSSGASKKDISPSELSQRVAVIKRFKELLKSQRERFRTYLDNLDKQKNVIESGSAEELLRHVELEEKIVADIFTIQKVIDPLEKMYKSSRPELPKKKDQKSKAGGSREADNSCTADEDEVFNLKEALDTLKTEAVVRSEQNRELLAKRMAELRSEIKSLRSNAYSRRGIDMTPRPTQIDIKG